MAPSHQISPAPQPGLSTKPEQPVPGVYVRTNGQPADIDMLWNGSRHYFKDEKSGIFNLFVGFAVGCILTSVLFITVFNQPAFHNLLFPAEVVAPKVVQPAALLKPDHATVVVEKGETLSGITDREYHNTAWMIQKQVITSNHLEENGVVKAGQVLRLPVIEH